MILPANRFPSIWEESIDVGDFIKMDLPKKPTIIDPWLRKSSLVMVYAERGIGKTWFALSAALAITTEASIGNWHTVTPAGVLYIDGEMAADEMQKRVKSLTATLPSPVVPLKLLSSDLLHQKKFPSVNINSAAWRKQIEDALTGQSEIGVLILDNLSCLTPGIEENDKNAWDSINQWLIRLRHKGIAVIFLHHAGKGGSQRGTSGREDALDIVIKLSRPPGHKPSNGARFIVSIEKARGVCGEGLQDFTFSIGENEGGNLVWLTDAITNTGNKNKIIALLGNGKSPKEIVYELDVTKQLVSKYKIWGVDKGFLYDQKVNGQCQFTKKGEETYAACLIDI